MINIFWITNITFMQIQSLYTYLRTYLFKSFLNSILYTISYCFVSKLQRNILASSRFKTIDVHIFDTFSAPRNSAKIDGRSLQFQLHSNKIPSCIKLSLNQKASKPFSDQFLFTLKVSRSQNKNEQTNLFFYTDDTEIL